MSKQQPNQSRQKPDSKSVQASRQVESGAPQAEQVQLGAIQAAMADPTQASRKAVRGAQRAYGNQHVQRTIQRRQVARIEQAVWIPAVFGVEDGLTIPAHIFVKAMGMRVGNADAVFFAPGHERPKLLFGMKAHHAEPLWTNAAAHFHKLDMFQHIVAKALLAQTELLVHALGVQRILQVGELGVGLHGPERRVVP